jgi:hypothetical protein
VYILFSVRVFLHITIFSRDVVSCGVVVHFFHTVKNHPTSQKNLRARIETNHHKQQENMENSNNNNINGGQMKPSIKSADMKEVRSLFFCVV